MKEFCQNSRVQMNHKHIKKKKKNQQMRVVAGGGGGLEQCFAIILEFYPKKIEIKQELWTVQTFLIFKQSCLFTPLQSILF